MLSQVVETAGAVSVNNQEEASFLRMLDQMNSDGILRLADLCEQHDSGGTVSMAAALRRLAAVRQIEEELD